MSTSQPTAQDWQKALPHIERIVAQTLEAVEQKLAVGETGVAVAEREEHLSTVLRERLQGFETLGQRAGDDLQKLDAELAADEAQLRAQLADMQAFRQSLARWIDELLE